MSGIIGAIIAGAVVGMLGRLILPGKQNVSILMTILIGVIASAVAGFVLNAVFDYSNKNGGLAWTAWLVGALLAAGGIVLYGNLTNKKV